MRDEQQTSFQATKLNTESQQSKVVEEDLAGRPRTPEIKCRNCLGNPKTAHTWDKHCEHFLSGKTVAEMQSKLKSDKAKLC